MDTTVNTLVISMNEDRRRDLIAQLNLKRSFLVHNISGVRGDRHINDRGLANRKSYRFLVGRDIWPGELGCSLAHVKAFKVIVEKGWEWTLILEDNSRLMEDTSEQLSKLLIFLSQSLEFSSSPTIAQLNASGDDKIIGVKIDEFKDFDLYDSYRLLGPTKAYLINQSAAQLALSRSLPIRTPPDYPGWTSLTHFLIPRDELFDVARNLPSEIGPKRSTIVLKRNSSRFRRVLRKILTLFLVMTLTEGFVYRIVMKRDYYLPSILIPRLIRFRINLNNYFSKGSTYPYILDSRFIHSFRSKLISNRGGLIRKRKITLRILHKFPEL